MTIYDFVVTNLAISSNQYLLTVEKVAVLDDDRLLDKWLSDKGITDKVIGETIEKLESIPYGHKVVNIDDHIVITQA